MLKMMAADNDDAYNLTPAFILETVAAAKGFIEKNLGNVTKVAGQRGDHVRIAAFLVWPQERVKHALTQFSAIEQGELSKKAVESLPTIHAAFQNFRIPKIVRSVTLAVPFLQKMIRYA
jgi:hypothetical protein